MTCLGGDRGNGTLDGPWFEHRWTDWMGVTTRFRLCQRCGQLDIDTRRKSILIDSQPPTFRRPT